MATTEKIVCDGPGCDRVLGDDHDVIRILVNHEIAKGDLPPEYSGGGATLYSKPLEFCSYDHVIAWFGSYRDIKHDDARVAALRKLRATAPMVNAHVPSGFEVNAVP